MFNFAMAPKKLSQKKSLVTHFGFGFKYASTPIEEGIQNIVKSAKEKLIDDYS